jgi:hypothetical protein
MGIMYVISGLIDGVRRRKSIDVLDIDDEDVVKGE